MFLEHYGLREHPFGVTPDPRYLYFSAMHREALASLFYGIETGCGFLALIAPPGMGKTTLLIHLLERLRKSARTVFLFQTQCDSREFFRYLLTDLGVDASNQNIAHMHESLNSVLLSNAQMGRRFVLVIDEAQNLKRPVLETVRLLSDFETTNSKLMQIVLCGQPQLADRLSHPDLMQLRQRISIVSRLQPFDKAEVIRYIQHRLNVAGYAGPALFDSHALDQIATHCDGIPRNINNICFNALTLGFAKGLQQIDGSTVSEVLVDLDMGLLRSPSGSAVTARPSLNLYPTLDSLETPDETSYRDTCSETLRARTNGSEGISVKSHAIPLTSGASSKATEAVQRGLSGFRVTEKPPEPKAAPDLDVTYLGPVRTTNARVPRESDRVEMNAENARNGELGATNPDTSLRFELNVFPRKHKTQIPERLEETQTARSKVSEPDASVELIGNNGHRTYSRERFCGLRIANIRQTIQNQSLFDHCADAEERLEENLSVPALTGPSPNAQPAEQSSVPASSISKSSPVFQLGANVAGPSSAFSIPKPAAIETSLDGPHKSDPHKAWKLMDIYRRAACSWSKRGFTVSSRTSVDRAKR